MQQRDRGPARFGKLRVIGFKLVGPYLDVGASFDERFERLAAVRQHAVAEHCTVAVGKRLAHEAGRDQLQPAKDRRIVHHRPKFTGLNSLSTLRTPLSSGVRRSRSLFGQGPLRRSVVLIPPPMSGAAAVSKRNRSQTMWRGFEVPRETSGGKLLPMSTNHTNAVMNGIGTGAMEPLAPATLGTKSGDHAGRVVKLGAT